MIPKFWQEFVIDNELLEKEIQIDEKDDLSQLGIDLKIMTFEQCIDESTECHPGIEASKIGYFPVAMCLEGSGDYYYISSDQGESGPLYRIYHDSVVGDKLASDGIEKVLESYVELAR
jgi:hypothetical protein